MPKHPKTFAYLCPLKTANSIPSARPPCIPPPSPPRAQGAARFLILNYHRSDTKLSLIKHC